MGMITEIGNFILNNIIQILLGCILSIPLYFLKVKKLDLLKKSAVSEPVIMIILAILGMLLPLSTYGLIPLVAVLYKTGTKTHLLVSFIFSNAMFNMLVPSNDPSFIWKTGIRRVIFALIAALVIGYMIKYLKLNGERLLHQKNLETMGQSPTGIKGFLLMLVGNIQIIGLYLIVGAVAEYIFQKYILWNTLELISSNPYTTPALRFFSGQNVGNPFFLITMTIVMMLLDLIKFSAMLVIFRIRGVVLYVVYFAALAGLLGLTAFV